MDRSEKKITRERLVEGPSSSIKSTTYESRTASSYDTAGSYDASSPMTYRPTLGPRQLVINRTMSSGPSGGRSVHTIERSIQYGLMGAPSGAYAVITSSGVNAVKSSREKEKRDMQDLNERFASYIEKVRFLEAQNRRLADELEKLKAKWGKETTQIKAMYQAELDEARRLLDEAEKDKARMEIKAASMEEQMEEMRQRLTESNMEVGRNREKIEHQNQQLSDYEAEINLLRRRLEGLETDRDKDRKLINQLQDSLNRARIDLDNETLLHIDAENRRQTLEEELEFLKQVHDQEMKELSALAYRDTTAENREFWKNEMGQALREIQQLYDDKMESMRAEMETFYNLKMQEFRTGATRQSMESTHAKEESKQVRQQMNDLRDKLSDLETRNGQLQRELDLLRREKEDRERELEDANRELQTEVVKLRAEMESILKELQEIIDTKLGLELEIAAYRKLLEGEENRIGLRQIVETIISNQDQQTSSTHDSSHDGGIRMSHVVKREMSAKTTYQRSSKGPVSIAECGTDGKFITLENTGRKEEAMGGWVLKRQIDGQDRAEFTLDNGCILQPGKNIKVWANGHRPESAPPSDLEAPCSTWGIGGNIITKLINQSGEDRATHIQKTVYSS